MDPVLLALFVAPPALALLYSLLEYTGQLDKWTGRRAAVDALTRLNSASGFPVSWIYDDEQDKKHFAALEKRISKKTTEKKIQRALASGHRPSCITVAGQPLVLTGLPSDWPGDRRRLYTPSHPVMYLFGVNRTDGKGKSGRVCSIGELELWLAEEKEARKYYVGALAIGLISLGFIALRLAAAG